MSSPQGIFQALAKHHSPEHSVWLCRKGTSWVDCLPNKQHSAVENGCSIFRWGPAGTIYFGVSTVSLSQGMGKELIYLASQTKFSVLPF